MKWLLSLRIWVWLGVIIAALFGLLTVSSLRLKKSQAEKEEVKKQLELSAKNAKVKEFQAINNERKDVADAKLDKELDELDLKLNGNTVYRL